MSRYSSAISKLKRSTFPACLHKETQNPFLWTGVFLTCRLVLLLLSPPAAHWIRGHHSGGRGRVSSHLRHLGQSNSLQCGLDGQRQQSRPRGSRPAVLQRWLENQAVLLESWERPTRRRIQVLSDLFLYSVQQDLQPQINRSVQTASVFRIRAGKILEPFRHSCCRFNPTVRYLLHLQIRLWSSPWCRW